MKVIYNKKTKGKETDETICKILTDIYKKSPSFDAFYEIFISVTKDSGTMEKVFDKYIPKDEKWLPKFLNEEKMEGALFGLDFMQVIMKHFNWYQIIKTTELLTKKYIARDIAKKYKISYPTIMKRLNKYFNIEKGKEWRVLRTVFIPRLDILVGLVVYFYFRDINSKHKNLFVDLFNTFENNYK